jgi:hypothetical protein
MLKYKSDASAAMPSAISKTTYDVDEYSSKLNFKELADLCSKKPIKNEWYRAKATVDIDPQELEQQFQGCIDFIRKTGVENLRNIIRGDRISQSGDLRIDIAKNSEGHSKIGGSRLQIQFGAGKIGKKSKGASATIAQVNLRGFENTDQLINAIYHSAFLAQEKGDKDITVSAEVSTFADKVKSTKTKSSGHYRH